MSRPLATYGFPEVGRAPQARSAFARLRRIRLPEQATTNCWRARVVLLGLTAVFVVAALWNPADELRIVLCPFRALTHYPCPGCGMTRAFCALAHGEFWRAIKLNPFSPLLFLAALVAWARAAAAVFRVERLRSALERLPRPTPFATGAVFTLVMAWWVVRLAWGV
jgi:hypothetical protein